MRIFLASFLVALLGEVALLLTWRVLASSNAIGPGVIKICWIWPLSWLVLLLLGVGIMLLERRLSRNTLGLADSRVAGIMLLRLCAPILLLVGPGLVLLYAGVMFLTAVGVTTPQVPG